MFLRPLYKIQRKIDRRIFPNRRTAAGESPRIWPRNFAQEAFWFKLVFYLASLCLGLLLISGFLWLPVFTFWTFVLFTCFVSFIFAEDNSIKLLDKYCDASNVRSAFCRLYRSILIRLRKTKTSHARISSINIFFVICGFFVLTGPDDSPIKNSSAIPYVPYASFMVGSAAFFWTVVVIVGSDKYRQEKAIQAGDRLRRREEFASVEAEQKMKKINAILAEFGSFRHMDWFTSFFLRTSGIAEKESDIQSMFEYPATETVALNCLIRICKLETLLLHIRDRPGRQSRSMLIDLLCVERIDELDVRSRALIIHAIMTNNMTVAAVAEEAVKNLVLKTCGDALSALKSMTDAKGSVHSFYKLVFEDVSEPTRDVILAHCRREAVYQVALRTISQNPHLNDLISTMHPQQVPIELDFLFDAKSQAYTGRKIRHQWLKILTDIDDTLLCSGGWYPAGIDSQYPPHVVYPGVTTFLHAMEENLVEMKRQVEWWILPSTIANRVSVPADEQIISDQTHLVGLSARPHIPGDILESRAFSQFENMQKYHGLRSMPTLLTGALDTGGAFMFTGELEYLGKRKFETFQQYVSLYPEFKFIFVGDNGQADLIVALMILQKFPNVVDQVYIHEVQERTQTSGYSQYIALRPELQKKVYFYGDYVDAAIHAATRAHQLISFYALWRIAVAAVNDFDNIKAKWISAEQKCETGQKLNQSITRANEVLHGASIKLSVRYLDFGEKPECTHAVASENVRTMTDAIVQTEAGDEHIMSEIQQQQLARRKWFELMSNFNTLLTKSSDEMKDIIGQVRDAATNPYRISNATGVSITPDRGSNSTHLDTNFESCQDLLALAPEAKLSQ